MKTNLFCFNFKSRLTATNLFAFGVILHILVFATAGSLKMPEGVIFSLSADMKWATCHIN